MPRTMEESVLKCVKMDSSEIMIPEFVSQAVRLWPTLGLIKLRICVFQHAQSGGLPIMLPRNA